MQQPVILILLQVSMLVAIVLSIAGGSLPSGCDQLSMDLLIWGISNAGFNLIIILIEFIQFLFPFLTMRETKLIVHRLQTCKLVLGLIWFLFNMFSFGYGIVMNYYCETNAIHDIFIILIAYLVVLLLCSSFTLLYGACTGKIHEWLKYEE